MIAFAALLLCLLLVSLTHPVKALEYVILPSSGVDKRGSKRTTLELQRRLGKSAVEPVTSSQKQVPEFWVVRGAQDIVDHLSEVAGVCDRQLRLSLLFFFWSLPIARCLFLTLDVDRPCPAK